MKTHQLVVQDLAIAELQQHPENANNGDVDAIADSIAVNGFYQPIIVQAGTGYVLAGNHRLLAELKLGHKTIPGIVLDVDDTEAKRIMVADNRITRLGHDDEGQLANLLEDLYATDAGLGGTGFDFDDYEYLMALVRDPFTAADVTGSPDPAPSEHIGAGGGKRLNFSVLPQVDDDGNVYELLLSRPNYSRISANDLNLLRVALGQAQLSHVELASYGVPSWNGGGDE